MVGMFPKRTKEEASEMVLDREELESVLAAARLDSGSSELNLTMDLIRYWISTNILDQGLEEPLIRLIESKKSKER